ncbi:MAG: hypothetical protein HEQ20_18035 [Aphanizomenon flos-aquae KM1D3_PB]|uniref:hypothetical protein n=1 Tax=Aphanizomenon flos-aquae TaxID=1176 RepID=UPI0012699D3F|nr:hypothetical protein [Aphanizomenon flos-aquae]QSV72299.1 MAG: hypothetical protein HEQ20_18035 [Aphanizomenon flos-aquae KM1D3_PB]
MSLWQGKRQEARGKSEEGLGDFTFLYTVWFYCVHLLSRAKLNSLVERGNREHFDKLSASQGTGNRKISCVINSVPLLSNLLDNKSLLVVKNYY